MKKLMILFFSVVVMIGISSTSLSAQSEKKPTVTKAEKDIIPTPIPKKTHEESLKKSRQKLPYVHCPDPRPRLFQLQERRNQL